MLKVYSKNATCVLKEFYKCRLHASLYGYMRSQGILQVKSKNATSEDDLQRTQRMVGVAHSENGFCYKRMQHNK